MKKILLFALIVVTFASCARQGYGCKGRGKLITRVPQ